MFSCITETAYTFKTTAKLFIKDSLHYV